jgi:hypothetical protein
LIKLDCCAAVMISISPRTFHRTAMGNPRNPCSRQALGCEPVTEQVMADNNAPKAGIGIILGGILVLSAAFFILTGGDLGGKKTVQGDRDLPPVASGTATK